MRNETYDKTHNVCQKYKVKVLRGMLEPLVTLAWPWESLIEDFIINITLVEGPQINYHGGGSIL